MLLRAAYAQASVRFNVMPSKAETVYRAVHVARSETFRRRLRELGGRTASADIASGLALTQVVEARPYECRRLFVNAKRTD
jgi:hypothetical protein